MTTTRKRGGSKATRDAMASVLRLARPAEFAVDTWGHRFVVISVHHKMCTLDLERRCFRAGGFITHGAAVKTGGTSGYRGRGWVARMHADAVAWLAT